MAHFLQIILIHRRIRALFKSLQALLAAFQAGNFPLPPHAPSHPARNPPRAPTTPPPARHLSAASNPPSAPPL